MKDRNLKIISGFSSFVLLITLIIKLKHVPGGMILSGLFLGMIVIIGILFICLAIAPLMRLIFKKYSFFTLYLLTTAVGFSIFHYQLYSPTLKITVPNGYKGEVILVLSKVKDNILEVDSNGIGYLNQWTFDKTYSPPAVVDKNGTNIYDLCVGFDPSSFLGKGATCCIGGREIKTMNFEIVPKEKKGQKQYYSKDITTLVNKKLVLFLNSDEHTKINSASTKN